MTKHKSDCECYECETARDFPSHQQASPTDAELIEQHLQSPQVGDYWHECYTPICVVLGVVWHGVVICDHIQKVNKDRWTWNLDARRYIQLEDFREWLTKDNLGDVSPKAHAWVKEHLI